MVEGRRSRIEGRGSRRGWSTTRRCWSALFLLLVILVPLGLVSAGQTANSASPKLLIVLVVDQMRADYVETYGEHWTGGLRRLFDDGAWFTEAAYPYRATETCAGHATIATGQFPSAHGMVQNAWWDRSSGQMTACTSDASATPISYGGPVSERHGPRALRAPTIGDLMRQQSRGTSTVVSLSLKARSAIALAGQHGDSVVWLDEAHTWASSTAFTDAPVTAVSRYVDQHPIEADVGLVWTRRLPIERYRHGDDEPGETSPAGWTPTFPHPMDVGFGADDGFFVRWSSSPFSDAYLIEMAISLVDAFHMGSGNATDYLAIGLSALDLVGHQFGPDSQEVEDVLARLDDAVGSLLDALDARLGPDGYTVALSADHGVAAMPERLLAQDVDAGRFDARALVAALEAHLGDRLGRDSAISALVSSDLYFAPGVYAALQERPEVLESLLDLIRATPGVAHVYRRDELERGAAAGDAMAHAATLSYLAERSGDLIIVLKRHWIPAPSGTTHGSPYGYDTRVPVVLFGAGVRPGIYMTPATPADLAPTLAVLAGFRIPGTDGKILTEALDRSEDPGPSTTSDPSPSPLDDR